MRTFNAIATCLLVSFLSAVPGVAHADIPSTAPPEPKVSDVVEPAPLKTLTFISLASINDFAFGYVFGGLVGGGGMILANLTTGWGLYHVHEKMWMESANYVHLPQDTTELRTATFTAVNSARIYGLGLLLTGSAAIAAGFVVFNAVGDAVAYVVTDRIWLPDAAPEGPVVTAR